MQKIFSAPAPEWLAQVTGSIVALASPEKIFLLSVLHHLEAPENIFKGDPFTEHRIDSLLLLVLAREAETKSADELQNIIEHGAIEHAVVTALVLPVQQFNRWLMKNHPFATRVYRQATLVYDAGVIPLAIPNVCNEAALQQKLQNTFDTHIIKAIEFISGAEWFVQRKQYPLAAFHLHQAVEQLYSGIIRFTTGLRVHTHNIDKLYRYARHLRPGIYAIFPRDSLREKELFRQLQKAYIDGRYNSTFSIKAVIISQLSERVQNLLQLCKNLSPSKHIIS